MTHALKTLCQQRRHAIQASDHFEASANMQASIAASEGIVAAPADLPQLSSASRSSLTIQRVNTNAKTN
jgi:hypothetical protein